MRLHGALAVVPLLAIGVGLSLAAAWTFRQQERRAIFETLESDVRERTFALERALAFNIEPLLSLRDLCSARNPTRLEFDTFAERALVRHSNVRVLEWVPRIPHGERERSEREARLEGHDSFSFTEQTAAGALGPAGERDEYFPVYYLQPYAGNERALGFDLASDPERRMAIEQARDSGALSATSGIRLVQSTRERQSLLVIAPIYSGQTTSVAARRQQLIGFVVGALDLDGIVEPALRMGQPLPEGIRIRVTDESDPADVRELYASVDSEEAWGGNGLRRWPFEVADRRWAVTVQPLDEYFAERRTWLPQAALLIGLLLTGLLSAYVGVADTRARGVERIVDSRTQELVEANSQLEQQRGLLQSILDNLGDGVAVAGADGKLTLFNPAAGEILGRGLIDSGPESWSEIYGLFRPDTVTPVPTDELPLAQAIAGQESRDVEMFVRNPDRKGGAFIRVTATPLRDARGRSMGGGVAVFRDISERKWSEAVLRDSAERFRSIVEATASALIILSAEHRIREFNPRAERIFGLSRAEALGQDFLELCMAAEYREAVAADIRTALAGEATPGFEVPVVTGERSEQTLLWSFSRLAEAGDRESLVIATGHDVTERRQAERSRRVRELAAHLQSAREEERTRVAREIHDELGQALTGLKLEVSFVSRHAGEDNRDTRHRLEAVGRMIDQTIGSVRQIATDLRPQILDALGLVEAIRWQAGEFEKRTGIPCAVELPDDPIECGRDRATALFRILQEALTNVARHAGATRAHVRISHDEERILLEIDDDGRGIAEEQAVGSRSFGLLGMEERAHEFGGTLRIAAAEPRGTTISVSIPY